MEKIYTERANGRDEYWTYSAGQRIYVTRAWALRQIDNKSARLIRI